VEIGGHDALGVLEALQPLVNRDNDMGTLLVAPQLAVIPEILAAMQLIVDPSRVTVVLQPSAGREVRLDLRPLAAGAQAEWRGAPNAQRAEYLRHAQENFWAGHLGESGIDYARINVLQDLPARTLTLFARDIDALTKAHPQGRLVIDFSRLPRRRQSKGPRAAARIDPQRGGQSARQAVRDHRPRQLLCSRERSQRSGTSHELHFHRRADGGCTGLVGRPAEDHPAEQRPDRAHFHDLLE
jgi:hypothetical protein